MSNIKKLLIFVGLIVIGILVVVYISALQQDANNPTNNRINLDVGNDIACTLEAKLCSDGSYVGRNALNNCEFDECPQKRSRVSSKSTSSSANSEPKICAEDLQVCTDGSIVNRDPELNCDFAKCPASDTDVLSDLDKKYTDLYRRKPSCRGDYNRDKIVDIKDLQKFTTNYRQQNIDCEVDIVGDDCFVDIADFILFADIYNKANLCLAS